MYEEGSRIQDTTAWAVTSSPFSMTYRATGFNLEIAHPFSKAASLYRLYPSTLLPDKLVSSRMT